MDIYICTDANMHPYVGVYCNWFWIFIDIILSHVVDLGTADMQLHKPV